jgi:pilus assembly protein CpaC
LPEGQTPLGTTPRPSPATLQKFGQYVERVIDPENTLDVIIGRPRVIVLKQNPVRFQLEEEQIARVIPLFENRQLSITGLRTGTTILNLWFGDPNNPEGQTVLSYLLRVLPDPEAKQRLERVYEALGKEINRLFPDSVVRLTLAGDKVVITGQAKDVVEASQIIQIVSANAPGQARNQFQGLYQGQGQGQGQGQAAAIPLPLTQFSATGVNPATGALNTISEAIPGIAGYGLPTIENYQLASATNIINLLRVPGEQQVMLKVTVAEVDRAASRTVGMDFSILNKHGTTVFASNLSGQPLPTGGNGNTSGGATASGGGNIVTVLDNGRIVSSITALRTLNFARTLAEPNLVTTNGQPASFLAGGEFPVPVTSGFATNIQGVQFVPFGVQLRFTPYVTDKDRIRLVVVSNVSTRDPASGATIGGATVSGLNSRSFQTTVELRDGQTIAVAGLMQNSYGGTARRVPFFGDLPIIGRFAAVDGSSSNEQELVVLITPMLVHPYDPHQVPPLPGSDVFEPGDLEFYLLGRLESRRPYDYRAGVRTDIHRMLRYRFCDDVFISGPHGHSSLPQ